MKKEYIFDRNGMPTNSFAFVLEPEEEVWIKANYGKLTAKYMAQRLGVSQTTMNKFLDFLIPSRVDKERPWSEEDDNMLKELYSQKTDRVIASIMARTRRSISNRALYLRLYRDGETQNRSGAKELRTCCGRFCEKKCECVHYIKWLKIGKPSEGQLNNGNTTRCINEGTFRDFISTNDNSE